MEKLILAGGALVDEFCHLSGNSQIIAAWEALTLKSRVYIQASLSACQNIADLGPLWRAIVVRVKTGDRLAARAAARDMVRRMLDDLDLDGNF